MTVCNMSIEAGARAGLDRPRRHHLRLPRGPRPTPRRAPPGTAPSTTGARCPPTTAPPSTRRSRSTPPTLVPHVSWGTNPGQVVAARPARCPTPTTSPTRATATPPRGPSSTWASPPARRCARSPSTPCSSARAPTAASRTCGPPPRWPRAARSTAGVRAMVVPGSFAVKEQAEAEGLDTIFTAAGFDWREPGCSMCLAMNPDKLAARRALRRPPATATSRAARAGAAAPTSSPPPWPPPPPSPAHFATPDGPGLRSRLMEAVTHRHRHRRAARPLRRRHRPDHPQRLAQAGRAHRLRRRACSRSGATTASFVLNHGAVRRRQHPRGRPQLRHRLVAASTPCGRSWTTASRPSISPRFADIFRNNCTKNGLVPVRRAGRGRRAAAARPSRPTPRSRSPSTSSAARSSAPAIGHRGRVPARRLHPGALPRGPRRHRHHPRARGRHHRLRGHPPRPGCPPPPRPDPSPGSPRPHPGRWVTSDDP